MAIYLKRKIEQHNDKVEDGLDVILQNQQTLNVNQEALVEHLEGDFEPPTIH